MANNKPLYFSILLLLLSHHYYGIEGFLTIGTLKEKLLKNRHSSSSFQENLDAELLEPVRGEAKPIFVGSHDGLKERDKIDRLPGQPNGVDFNQYSGYVTIDSKIGRAFFYYFVESSKEASSKPLVLWFGGETGCSFIGIGAFSQIGPFRVDKGSKTLHLNHHSWNREANILFVDSPAGVGFSYLNVSSEFHYNDPATVHDIYIFLINWLQRFPEYKDRDVFLVTEGYLSRITTRLGQLILQNNQRSDRTKINLKGIALGNAFYDTDSDFNGTMDYVWSHALISDETHLGVKSSCTISSIAAQKLSKKCLFHARMFENATAAINPGDIYSPFCNSTPGSDIHLAPCFADYVSDYISNPVVQTALHANIAYASHPWKLCNETIMGNWTTPYPETLLPIITELMDGGIRVWVYTGDTDFGFSITSAKYAINKLQLSVITPWYPWYHQNQVGGYVVEYEKLVFATVRGAGRFLPAFKPAIALSIFSSFVNGKLPPSN